MLFRIWRGEFAITGSEKKTTLYWFYSQSIKQRAGLHRTRYKDRFFKDHILEIWECFSDQGHRLAYVSDNQFTEVAQSSVSFCINFHSDQCVHVCLLGLICTYCVKLKGRTLPPLLHVAIHQALARFD